MFKIKRLVSLITGLVTSLVGIVLRLNASEMAWPDSYSYSGAREHTIWGIREQTYIDIGTTMMYFGMILIMIVFINWLWSKDDKL